MPVLFAAVTLLASCLLPPVSAPVVDGFEAPPCPYCAGRRGVVFATVPGAPVVAAAAGRVSYVGDVAGTTYLVIRHDDGVRATYGRLDEVADGLDTGDPVVAGAVVGRASERLYFGLRAADETSTPIDPLPLLGTWRARARLVPTDGTAGRTPGAPRLVCQITRERR